MNEMLKVLALGAHKELKSIQKNLHKQDIELTTAQFFSVRIEVNQNQVSVFVTGKDILDYDFVWLKSSWHHKQIASSIAVYLQYMKIPFTQVEAEKVQISRQYSLGLQ